MVATAANRAAELPTSPGYFEWTAERFWDVAVTVHRAALALEAARAAVADHRAALELIEATWLLDGLALPDGSPCKNEAQREAVLVLRRSTDTAWKRAKAALDSALVAQATRAADLDLARDQRGQVRRQAEYAIAAAQLAASTDGRTELETREQG